MCNECTHKKKLAYIAAVLVSSVAYYFVYFG